MDAGGDGRGQVPDAPHPAPDRGGPQRLLGLPEEHRPAAGAGAEAGLQGVPFPAVGEPAPARLPADRGGAVGGRGGVGRPGQAGQFPADPAAVGRELPQVGDAAESGGHRHGPAGGLEDQAVGAHRAPGRNPDAVGPGRAAPRDEGPGGPEHERIDFDVDRARHRGSPALIAIPGRARRAPAGSGDTLTWLSYGLSSDPGRNRTGLPSSPLVAGMGHLVLRPAGAKLPSALYAIRPNHT